MIRHHPELELLTDYATGVNSTLGSFEGKINLFQSTGTGHRQHESRQRKQVTPGIEVFRFPITVDLPPQSTQKNQEKIRHASKGSKHKQNHARKLKTIAEWIEKRGVFPKIVKSAIGIWNTGKASSPK